MDQLSSCYFCGGALDVSLSEYPIVPKSLDPEAEQQGTVVLCSTCREKLATIIEPAVEAAKADAREASEPVADAGTTADEPTTTDSVVEPADDGSLLGDDSTSAPEREPLEQSARKGEPTPERDAVEATAADTTDQRTAESTEDGDTGTAATGAGSGDAGSSENSDGSADGPSLTKLEYNKVMRLLKNREMPVDRAEIREVAINAYDLEGEQFDAIIDAAVDRDLIGQTNGQLVDSDG